jgi:RNA polymerase sigma-70 factor (ECF subfamily)
MEYSDLGDTDLAIAWKRGDPRAFDELVRRFQGRVYAVAYRVTGNREDALDVAQEALIKAYQRINTWQPTGGFLPWLLLLTTNQAIDHLRRRKRQPQERLDETFVPDSEGAPVEPAVESAGQTVRAHEIDERVRGALHTLSPSQRTVFVLRHYEGQSLAEIAAQMGCTVGSVKVHLFRSLQKLRKELGGLDL